MEKTLVESAPPTAVFFEQAGRSTPHEPVSVFGQLRHRRFEGREQLGPAFRGQIAERWTELFTSLEPAMAELPEYRDWLVGVRSTGLLKKCSGGDCASASVLLRHTLSVLRQIPQPLVPLAEPAARATRGRPAPHAGKP